MHSQTICAEAPVADFGLNGFLRTVLLLVHLWLPVMVGCSTALLVHRTMGEPLSSAGLALLLAGIGAAYHFDRLIDCPPGWSGWGTFAAFSNRGILLVGLAGCAGVMGFVLLFGKIGTGVLPTLAALSAVSVSYVLLKRVPLVKTLAVAGAWTWATATLPFAGRHGAAAGWALLDNGVSPGLLLLFSAGCILCDIKDAAHDRRNGVPSLPALFGPPAACTLATGLALAAVATAVWHQCPGIAVSGLLLAAAARFPELLARAITGPVLVDSILLVPGLLAVC